jgi:alpha-ketoglutaric semialdehyde dehydrogenase
MSDTFGNYIDGRWTGAGSGRSFENRNPADTSELIGTFADSGPEDVEKAVAAARAASPGWKALPAPRRGEILYRAAEILRRRKEDLSRDMTREMGKILD